MLTTSPDAILVRMDASPVLFQLTSGRVLLHLRSPTHTGEAVRFSRRFQEPAGSTDSDLQRAPETAFVEELRRSHRLFPPDLFQPALEFPGMREIFIDFGLF